MVTARRPDEKCSPFTRRKYPNKFHIYKYPSGCLGNPGPVDFVMITSVRKWRTCLLMIFWRGSPKAEMTCYLLRSGIAWHDYFNLYFRHKTSLMKLTRKVAFREDSSSDGSLE